MRRRERIGALAVLACGAMLVSCAPAVDPPGAVDWKTYPAHAHVPAEDVLAAPSGSDHVSRGFDVLEDARNAVTAGSFGGDWVQATPEQWHPFDGNGYGGDSLLSYYVAPTWQLEIELPRTRWDDIVEAVARVAETQGMTPRDRSEEVPSEWMTLGSFHGSVDYLEVVVQDARLNEEELALARSQDLMVAGITLTYGGTTVRDADREEFARAAAAFEGLERPPATSE